jgi:DNA-binding IclR family transcriptional regulator
MSESQLVGLPKEGEGEGRRRHSRVLVKSAGRVLIILEYFDSIRREANVIEVCRALGYPQSSTSLLLRSLVTLGYLRYNVHGRTYVPTNRVPLLGNWVNRSLYRDGKIYQLFDQLSEATGQLVVLAARNEYCSQYIYRSQPEAGGRVGAGIGMLRPLISSACGRAILSAMPEVEMGRVIRRFDVQAQSQSKGAGLEKWVRELAQVRTGGYVYATLPEDAQRAEIAMPLFMGGTEVHAIALVGAAQSLGQNLSELAHTLQTIVSANLGTRISNLGNRVAAEHRAFEPMGRVAAIRPKSAMSDARGALAFEPTALFGN